MSSFGPLVAIFSVIQISDVREAVERTNLDWNSVQ
jgi:hypothetical protein